MKQFLTGISLCVVLLATGGCTDRNELLPDSDDDNGTGTPVSLTIRATMSNFANLPPTGANPGISTRATDSGNTTTFKNGDKIGIYAAKGQNNFVDNIENTCLTYSVGSDGTGRWMAEGVTFHYNPDVTYFAYYPYKENIGSSNVVVNPDNPKLFAQNLIQKDEFKLPDKDQSASDFYATHDLMTAYGKPVDGATQAEKILQLDFKHAYAVFILIPAVHVRCTLPADVTTGTYDNVMVPDIDGNVTYIGLSFRSNLSTNVTPYRMSDGSYRALLNPNALNKDITPMGSYTTRTPSGGTTSVNFEGSAIPEIAAGHSYTLTVCSIEASDFYATVERPLATGDFVTKHGQIIPPNSLIRADKSEINFTTSDIVGIIVTTDPDRMTDEECNGKGWNHAYVMGINSYKKKGNQPTRWATVEEDEPIPNITDLSVAKNDMNGYAETIKMQSKISSGSSANYPIYEALEEYKSIYSLSFGDYSSPWFLPSVGQWFDAVTNLGKVSPEAFTASALKNPPKYGWAGDNEQQSQKIIGNINKYLQKAGGGQLSTTPFVCSSEATEELIWVFTVRPDFVGLYAWSKMDSSMDVYPFFAF